MSERIVKATLGGAPSARARASARRCAASGSAGSAGPSILKDSPAVRGMIARVAHLVETEG